MSSRRAPSARASDGRGKRVVDVVEAGHAELDAAAPFRRVQLERDRLEAVQLDRAARPRPAAGARARTPGSGSRRGGRCRRRRTCRAFRSGRTTSSRRRAAARGRRGAGRPGRTSPRAGRAREIADLRVVRVHDQRSACPAAPRPCPASAPPRARARRSGRAGRGRGCRGRRRAAAAAARPRAAPPRPPRRARARASGAASRAEATPETRFAPEWLCASRADGRQDPGGHRRGGRLAVRRRDERATRGKPLPEPVDGPGSSFQSSFPGTVVPPPAPPGGRARRRPGRAESRPRGALGAPSRGRYRCRSLVRGNLGRLSPCRGMKAAVTRAPTLRMFFAAAGPRPATQTSSDMRPARGRGKENGRCG